MLQDLRDWFSDSDTHPGWGILFDADNVPYKALGYLSNFAGVTLPNQLVGESDAAYTARARNIIKTQPNQTRGTPAAMVAAARNSGGLIGPSDIDYPGQSATVIMRERDTSPYHLTVTTYTGQTANHDLVEAALISQKPAGIVMNYTVQDQSTWLDIRSEEATWGAVKADNATWQLVRDTPPH
jgi:hypothetical protein